VAQECGKETEPDCTYMQREHLHKEWTTWFDQPGFFWLQYFCLKAFFKTGIILS